MRILLLTNEYPPHVYGGAGVHVDYLSKTLSLLDNSKHTVQVLCFGTQQEQVGNLSVRGIKASGIQAEHPRHSKVLDALARNAVMAGAVKEADVVHCHTWYTHFAGSLIRQLHGIPLVLTTHSLEPHRPWKSEQLGAAYEVSKWVERLAYTSADGVIAISSQMSDDVQHLYGVAGEKIKVIHNGIDPEIYKPVRNPGVLEKYGIRTDKPFILFVGRITRQKGITHLVNAIEHVRPGFQVVLCAGAPDTEEIAAEVKERVERARTQTSNEIIWIPEVVPRERLITLYTQAELFICPSIYEPFGLINLEAMACGTPVVATAVGGIPEVVVNNETGLLVPFERAGGLDFEPINPGKLSEDLAAAINTLLESPETRRRMGEASRRRIEQCFTWDRVARQTVEFYTDLLNR